MQKVISYSELGFSSDADVRVGTLPDWITVSLAHGVGSSTVLVSVAENRSPYPRRHVMTFYDVQESLSAEVVISQSEYGIYLWVLRTGQTEHFVPLTASGRSVAVPILSSGDWHVVLDGELPYLWVESEGQTHAVAAVSTSGAVFDVAVLCSGGWHVVLDDPYLWVDREGQIDYKVSVPADGSTVPVSVLSNGRWHVVEDNEPYLWLDWEFQTEVSAELPYSVGSTNVTVISNVDWEIGGSV